jgi:hypothetical protein
MIVLLKEKSSKKKYTELSNKEGKLSIWLSQGEKAKSFSSGITHASRRINHACGG